MSGLYVKAENGLRLRSRRVRRLVQRIQATMPWVELDRDGVVNETGEPRRLLAA